MAAVPATPAPERVPRPAEDPPAAAGGWRWPKLATPVLVLLLAIALVITLTWNWNSWEGGRAARHRTNRAVALAAGAFAKFFPC